jgi:class 3 adenylate cyclase/tetratricopeptide (TPR) repeat protein
MEEADKLQQAIQALDAQRAVIGDDVVEAAIGPLRERLAQIETAQAEESVPAQPASQQRRIITILFADVSGYTAMSEHMDAEDVRDTMNALWQELDNIILAHGGKIDKHMGDGVMALWGADETREDDPERTIRAGLLMQAALADFRPAQKAASGLKMRIGLNTGPVLLGSIGTRGEITAIGDTVNMASRLEEICPAGGILISHDTYRHVRGVFEVETRSPLQIKGKSEPVQTYLVTAVKPRAFRLYTRGIEDVETRMIGRDDSLARLRMMFEDSLVDGRLSVVTISGDAGIGKSRLLYEFNAWAELQRISWWVFKGRASQSMQNTPYALLRDIFATRFEIQDSDSLTLAHEKMEKGFAEFLPGVPDSQEKAHVIGHLIGLDFSDSPYLRGLLNDPRQLRQQALFYLARFFSVVCADSPALVMLDDLQWADSGSLDALQYLCTNMPQETPLMTLAVARPTLFERYPDWARDVKNHTRIHLHPLSKDDSRLLVNEILRKVPELPDAIRELVVGGAEGNPFYLEELIKMLIDQRVICPDEEQWRVEPGRLASVHVPSTLSEVLQARLDSLSINERLTIQRAAVVGRIFWDQAILHTSPDLAEDDVRQALQSLRRKELVYERRPAAFIGTHEYTFKHSLFQEVTYETLLKRQRASLHILAARWLDHASGERRGEYLTQIGEHYEKGGDSALAAGIFSQAAGRALNLSALSEAREFFEHAIGLLEQPDKPLRDVIEMQIGLADACLQLGEYSRARQHAETAASMAGEIGIDILVAEALVQLGQVASYLGNYLDAFLHLSKALDLARQDGNLATIARVLVALGGVEWRLGKIENARQHCEESYQIASQNGDTTTLLNSLNRLGVLMGALGQPDEEENYYQQALSLALSVGNRERAATSLNNLGALAGEQGQWQKSWDYYQRALAISYETGAKQGESMHLINLGLAAIKLERYQAARENLSEGAKLALEIGAQPILVSAMLYFALLAREEGSLEQAARLLGVAKSHPSWDSENEREVNLYLGDLESTAPQPESAQNPDWETTLSALVADS